MIEIYENISEQLKKDAETAWQIALAQKSPSTAADFLNNVTEFYRNKLTEDEQDFLQFYFNMKMMEMTKE